MLRKMAAWIAYGVAECLFWIEDEFDTKHEWGMDSWWLNDGPGQSLLQFAYASRIQMMDAGINYYHWDCATNTITEKDAW